MKTKAIRLGAAFAVLVLAGCGSIGTQVSQDAAMRFTEGVSTEADIVRALGKPTAVTISGGKRSIAYTGAQYSTKPETFIPFVGAFVGGVDYTTTTATFKLDKNGVLEEISYTGSGLASQAGTLPAKSDSAKPSAVE